MRLKPGTPQVVCYFLAGTLPGEALIHLRQFSILSMIIDTKDSILHQHGLNVLTTNPSTRSWFHQIRNLCLLYQLPHPLTLLQGSHTRLSFRVLAKKHVLNYWEKKLRGEAVSLTSLKYFKPDFMSLMKPHPMFSSAGSSPYEITKLALPCHELALTLSWPWPWHCHDPALTLTWPSLDLSLTLPWLCLDLALTLPWPCPNLNSSLHWLCLDLAFKV